jgi:glycerophosphoryl diester phosphodiesterase
MAKFDIQGHRGARGLRPENTLPAFEYAVRLGVTTLELDVVISRDGKVIVSHDPVLSSEICTWPDGRRVSEEESTELILYQMNLDKISEFDCGIRKNPKFPEQQPMPAKKPLLQDVIEEADRLATLTGIAPLQFNIETKCTPSGDGILHPEPGEFVHLLMRVLEGYENDLSDRCTVQSFDMRTLRIIHTDHSTYRTSLLAEASTAGGIDSQCDRLGFMPDIYSPDFSLVTGQLMERARERKVDVLPWTVNQPGDMSRMRDMGVVGLITDYPNRAIDLFRSGQTD